jgi:hypothetical protein
MTEAATTATTTETAAATTTTAAAATATAPWHQGIEADTLGFWQNKGLKLEDPKVLASELTKQYRQLESHIGAPPDQILRMPKADAKPEDVKAFWLRLGAPAESKDYDFSTVKLNGQPLDDALSATLREAVAQAFVPKDRATGIAAAVAKHIESAEAAKAAVITAKIAEEKAALKRDWGTNEDFNRLKAMEGARRLGIDAAGITAMENQIGYRAVMEAMRKIGVGTSEDTFVERGTASNGTPTTREGAQARLTELEANKDWGKRLKAKDAATVAEWRALTSLIGAEAA